MMKNLLFMSLLISLVFSGEAVSACGPAFDGAWKYEGVESNQKGTSLFVNNSKNGALYFETHTYLLNRIPSMRTYSEITYSTSRKLQAKKEFIGKTRKQDHMRSSFWAVLHPYGCLPGCRQAPAGNFRKAYPDVSKQDSYVLEPEAA